MLLFCIKNKDKVVTSGWTVSRLTILIAFAFNADVCLNGILLALCCCREALGLLILRRRCPVTNDDHFSLLSDGERE